MTATRPRLESAPATLYRYVWRVSGHRQLWLVLLACVVFPLTMVPLELQRRIVNNAIGRRDLHLLWVLCGLYVPGGADRDGMSDRDGMRARWTDTPRCAKMWPDDHGREIRP